VGQPVGSPEPVVDGRSARRHRNRDAVLDAVHALFVEGHSVPTTEDVAARSGVSLRSIYRYFPDRQELLQAALTRRAEVAEPLFVLAGAGQGSLTERIERFVDHRLALYDLLAPTARAALSGGVSAPDLTRLIRRRRRQLRDQASEQFGAEVDSLDAAGEDVLTAIDLLCQFESLERLRAEQGMSAARARRVLVTGVQALLSSAAH
jgi:AcrR family transcriptional regulator